MDSKIGQQLERYRKKNRHSMAMPGHKGGVGISEELKKHFFAYDVTELSDTGNLFEEEGAVATAQKRAASFYGSRETLFLVNGSTSGIFIMLLSVCRAGERILVNRNCHQSVIHACAVMGLIPIYLDTELIPGTSVPEGVRAEAVRKVLERETVSAVLLTSPNYYGIASEIGEIAALLKPYQIPLLVDEAHGAHFAAAPKIFPKSAVHQGADLVVQSAHKTLAAMNQTAFLHICTERVSAEKVRQAAKMLLTSSPSYAMLATADEAREQLERNGKEEWMRVFCACEKAREILSEWVVFPNSVCAKDPCRLVIPVSEYQTTGYAVAEKLREIYAVEVEMADVSCVVMLPSPSNSEKEILLAAHACAEILKKLPKCPKREPFVPPIQPEPVLTPKEAFDRKGSWIPLDAAQGKISKNTIVLYPPGTPLLVAGERILPQILAAIRQAQKIGAEITGLKQDLICVAED